MIERNRTSRLSYSDPRKHDNKCYTIMRTTQYYSNTRASAQTHTQHNKSNKLNRKQKDKRKKLNRQDRVSA